MTTCSGRRAGLPARALATLIPGIVILGALASMPARARQDGVLDPATMRAARGAPTALGGPAGARGPGTASQRSPLIAAGARYQPAPTAPVRRAAPAGVSVPRAGPLPPAPLPPAALPAHAVAGPRPSTGGAPGGKSGAELGPKLGTKLGTKLGPKPGTRPPAKAAVKPGALPRTAAPPKAGPAVVAKPVKAAGPPPAP